MMSDPSSAGTSRYQSLREHLQRLARIAAIQEQLAWDELTQLPDAATEYRGQQLAYVAGLLHELNCDPRLDEWLAEDPASETPTVRVNILELRRRHRLSRLVPQSLVEELARVTTTAQHEWALARESDDFGRFGIWLDRVVKLKREQARCWSAGPDLYEPLVAEYESGLDYTTILATLAALKAELPELVKQRLARQSSIHSPQPLQGIFAIAAQRLLCEQVAQQIGFDFRRGRLDTAVHPFTTHISADDCRFAIRFHQHNLAPVISVLLHEVGHALYDQGVPKNYFGEPVGEPISLSVHESQARLWENAVGRSLGFWRHMLPQIEAAFPHVRGQWSADQIVDMLHRVEPGANRVEADETTYNLHILLRVELERALLSGDLAARDLPAAWNQAYEELLDIKPESDRAGCLQDGHWAAGMFGYFPTYTLGNVLMAQLFERIQAELGPLDRQFASGNFRPLLDWLQLNLFRHGKLLSTAAWAQQLRPLTNTGELDLQPLLRRLASPPRSANSL